MIKNKAYRAVEVKQVVLEEVVAQATPGAVTVGVDLGKFEFLVVVRFADGASRRPWKVKNPSEIETTVRLLERLSKHHPVTVAMESTGTYGDALRRELAAVGLPVVRVSGKAASDYAEIFDGVPSQHDGKDAAIIAELAALGKARPWPYQEPSDEDSELAYWVDKVDVQQRMENFWTGRVEASLARHWPELPRRLRLNSVTLLSALAHYGGPAALAVDPEARRRLTDWSRGALTKEAIDEIMASAVETYGAKQNAYEAKTLQEQAAAALAAYRERKAAHRRLKELAERHEILRRQAKVVGAVTACVVWVALGDPRNYHCGPAYRKAKGLNLKERSSGQYQGRLKITKRGPSIVRRWLYFAALRAVKTSSARDWYEAKKAKDQGRGKRALIAVMRKLSLAMYAVGARDETFDPGRLFPGKLRGK
ncbi:MAG TPA: transposase, partial [Pirellulales bacterium]|nr:transposase [Pirellulales bacterium]